MVYGSNGLKSWTRWMEPVRRILWRRASNGPIRQRASDETSDIPITIDSRPDLPLPRWKGWLFWALFLVMCGTVAELSAHFALRAFSGYDGEHLNSHVFDAYKNIRPTPNFVDTRGIRHDAHGFRRSSDVKREKAPGTYRIFLMGGSTAYGAGGLWPHIQRDYPVLKNSETIDAFLERDLNAMVPEMDVEVINAAVTSFWTHHHLIYLDQTILGYDPDMILFLDGYNDLFISNKDHDQFAGYSANLPSRVVLGQPTLSSLFYSNARWLFRKSALANVLWRGARSVKSVFRWKSEREPLNVEHELEGLRQAFPRNALKMLARSAMILNAEDVVPVFMLQPLLALERDRAGMPEIERKLFEFEVARRKNYEEFTHRAVVYVREAEATMANDVGARFIDLTEIFNGVRGQVYTDYAHLTPLGNRVLAQHVATHIAPVIAGDLKEGGKAVATSPAGR